MCELTCLSGGDKQIMDKDIYEMDSFLLLSQRNIRIFDICYFLLGLLTEEEGLNLSQEQWLVFLENVLDGYDIKEKVSEAERRAIPYVMECIELLFVAYFEGTGESECAEDASRIYGLVKQQEEKIWEVCKVSR